MQQHLEPRKISFILRQHYAADLPAPELQPVQPHALQHPPLHPDGLIRDQHHPLRIILCAKSARPGPFLVDQHDGSAGHRLIQAVARIHHGPQPADPALHLDFRQTGQSAPHPLGLYQFHKPPSQEGRRNSSSQKFSVSGGFHIQRAVSRQSRLLHPEQQRHGSAPCKKGQQQKQQSFSQKFPPSQCQCRHRGRKQTANGKSCSRMQRQEDQKSADAAGSAPRQQASRLPAGRKLLSGKLSRQRKKQQSG